MNFFEIDFIEAGEKRSGDAIALRYGDLDGDNKTIHIVDGGFTDDGTKLVEHIKKYYENPDTIDHVISTHPDVDHAAGLQTVLDSFDVQNLWMNRPWNHIQELKPLFEYDYTDAGLEQKLKKNFPYTKLLEEIATDKQIPIRDVFQG
ncbi:MAG: MBL fold metallo-hydrolase, partial [Rhodospirillales bacterium]|nr:MBL fold metallo-hydrolase [Rhodospirillales bacterium]